MVSMNEFVRVDFNKPMPLFPLPNTVLLPHAMQQLQIFEPRYREMVNHCLDGAGQIAMACFDGVAWKKLSDELPPLRTAVCVGQIVQHSKIANDLHYIVLHGVCRAKIEHLLDPDSEHSYRMARLLPLESKDDEYAPLDEIRDDLSQLIRGPRLQRMRAAKDISKWFEKKDVSTLALLELIGSVLLHDCELKYQLLSEPSPRMRARIIKRELLHLDRLVSQAERQNFKSWPKGLSWN